MKKFLLIALAVMLVLASMVVLADETKKDPVPMYQLTPKQVKAWDIGPHKVSAGVDAVAQNLTDDCTEKSYAIFACEEVIHEDGTTCGELLEYVIRPAGQHATKDDKGNPVNSKYEGNVTPDCKTDAVKIYEECPVCGEKNFKVTEKGEHKWDEGVVIVDPAVVCEKDKVTKFTCSVCGETDEVTSEGTARAHKWEYYLNSTENDDLDSIVLPTCATPGHYKPYGKCVNDHCDATTETSLDAQYYVELDHEAYFKKIMTPKDEDETVCAMAKRLATTKAGKALWNTKIEELVPNHPEGYNWKGTYYAAVCYYEPETCMADGYITLECPECGDSYTVVLPQIDHSYVFTADKEAYPTCLLNGKGLVTCEYECGLKEQVEITAPGAHNDDATGTKAGKEKYTQVLKLKDDVEIKSNKLDDIFTCYEYTEHAHCAGYTVKVKIGAEEADEVTIKIACNHDEKTVKPGDAKLHVADPKYHVERPATCKEDGFSWDYCKNCGSTFGTEISKETVAHTWEYKTTDPTCEEDGKTIMTCKVCGATDEIIHPMRGHDYIVIEIQEADCAEKENHIWKEVCSNCGDEILHDDSYELFHKVDLKKFDPDNINNAYTAPTCTEDGSITFECSICHEPVVDQKIPAHGHAWEFDKLDAYVKNPLCDAINDDFDYGNYQTYRTKYAVKGYDADDNFIGYFEKFVPATCLKGATYERKCAICNTPDNKTVSDVIGHTLVDNTGKVVPFVVDTNALPTCTSTGKAYYNCAVCKKDAVLTLPKLNHNFIVEWNAEKRVYEKKCVEIAWANYNWKSYVVENPQDEKILPSVAAEVQKKLKAIDKTMVPGVDCDFCEALETNYTKYTLSYDEKTETVTITPDDKGIVLAKPLVRVTWSYTLSDGTIFSYTRNFKEDTTNTFELGGAETPTGAVLDTITVIVVDQSGLTAAEAIKQGYGWDKDIRK